MSELVPYISIMGYKINVFPEEENPMKSKFRPSIISYMSLRDITDILNELIEDNQQNEKMVKILTEKKVEVHERYGRR